MIHEPVKAETILTHNNVILLKTPLGGFAIGEYKESPHHIQCAEACLDHIHEVEDVLPDGDYTAYVHTDNPTEIYLTKEAAYDYAEHPDVDLTPIEFTVNSKDKRYAY